MNFVGGLKAIFPTSTRVGKLPREEIERALDKWCTPPIDHESGRETCLSDAAFKHIRNLLTHYDDSTKSADWCQRPRIFTILRNIKRLDVMAEFIACDCLDDMLPFPESELPASLGRSRSDFMSMQALCLTEAIELERGEQGKHVQFNKSGDLHFYNMRDLGGGAFGRVDVVWSRLSRKQFARKKFRRSWDIQKTRVQYGWFAREIGALKRLSHRHLVKIKGTYSDPNYFAFLMEPVAQCNLHTYLTRFQVEKTPTLRYFFGCLANAIAYLHSAKVYHMDIKLGNILVKHDRVYVADFGTAHDWSQRDRSTTWAATPRTARYMPPEQARDPNSPKNYAVDIWSLGVVFLEMTTVLKGAKLGDVQEYMLTHGTKTLYPYNNAVATTNWLEELRRIPGFEYDNLPLIWVKDMLAQDPHDRPLARQIYGQISEADTFCDDCCAKGEGWQVVGAFDTNSRSSSDNDSVAEFIDAEELSTEHLPDRAALLEPQQKSIIQSWIDRTEGSRRKVLPAEPPITELPFDVEDDSEKASADLPSLVEVLPDPIPARLSGINIFAEVLTQQKSPNDDADESLFDIESDGSGRDGKDFLNLFDIESDGQDLSQKSEAEAEAEAKDNCLTKKEAMEVQRQLDDLEYGGSGAYRKVALATLPVVEENDEENETTTKTVFNWSISDSLACLYSRQTLSSLPQMTDADSDHESLTPSLPCATSDTNTQRSNRDIVIPESTKAVETTQQPFRSLTPNSQLEQSKYIRRFMEKGPNSTGQRDAGANEQVQGSVSEHTKVIEHRQRNSTGQKDRSTTEQNDKRVIEQRLPILSEQRQTHAIKQRSTNETKQHQATAMEQKDERTTGQRQTILNQQTQTHTTGQRSTNIPDQSRTTENKRSRRDSDGSNRRDMSTDTAAAPLTAKNLQRLVSKQADKRTVENVQQQGNKVGGSIASESSPAPRKRQFWPGQKVSAKAYLKQANRRPDEVATTVITKRTQAELNKLVLGSWLNKSTPILEEYVRRGGVAAVRVLLKSGCNPGTKQKPNRGPLRAAIKGASLRHNKCADALLRAGANPNARTSQTGRSMLSLAIENQNFPGYRGLIWTLLHWGADPNIKDNKGDYPLLQILYGGYEPLGEHRREALALILESQYPVDVNVEPPGTLNMPLHLASRRKDPWAVGMLLEKGAKVNAKNAAGQSPFAVAVSTWARKMTADHKEVARLLLAKGANVGEVMGAGRTPALFSALRNHHLDLVELLVRYGADPLQTDAQGQNALELLLKLEEENKLDRPLAGKMKAVLNTSAAVDWDSDSDEVVNVEHTSNSMLVLYAGAGQG